MQLGACDHDLMEKEGAIYRVVGCMDCVYVCVFRVVVCVCVGGDTEEINNFIKKITRETEESYTPSI